MNGSGGKTALVGICCALGLFFAYLLASNSGLLGKASALGSDAGSWFQDGGSGKGFDYNEGTIKRITKDIRNEFYEEKQASLDSWKRARKFARNMPGMSLLKGSHKYCFARKCKKDIDDSDDEDDEDEDTEEDE